MIVGTRLGSERTPKRSFEEMAMLIRLLFELRLPYEGLYRLHCGTRLDHLPIRVDQEEPLGGAIYAR
jgi:hypothetical protein